MQHLTWAWVSVILCSVTAEVAPGNVHELAEGAYYVQNMNGCPVEGLIENKTPQCYKAITTFKSHLVLHAEQSTKWHFSPVSEENNTYVIRTHDCDAQKDDCLYWFVGEGWVGVTNDRTQQGKFFVQKRFKNGYRIAVNKCEQPHHVICNAEVGFNVLHDAVYLITVPARFGPLVNYDISPELQTKPKPIFDLDLIRQYVIKMTGKTDL